MPTHDEILTIGLDADISGALRDVARFQKEVERKFRKLTKTIQSVGKANEAVAKGAEADTKNWIDELGALTRHYEDEIVAVHELEMTVHHLNIERTKADGKEQKNIDDRIKALQKEITERKKAAKTSAARSFDVKAMTDDAKKGMTEAGSALKDSMSSFFGKDLKGMLSGSGRMLAKGFGGGLRGLAAGGAHLKAAGEARIRTRTDAGKGGGFAGGAMKAVGGVFEKLGPMINIFSKLGPLISTVSSAVMALVKLFIDAESQAKQFQKEILQSASTAEFLAQAGGNADLAFTALEGTLEDIRDAAYNVEDNMAWGTNADMYKGVLNTLNQEGVSIMRITQEAQKAGKTVGAFTKDLMHVSVAYSRAFGVPLQEINQLQAEMMTEMGMSLDETRMAFSQMTRDATNSGIAANKFFSIIRGVSQDLSLYNVRMDHAGKMLKMLGKVMNPREAQKFMQTAMRGLKDMGRMERIQMTIMAGVGPTAQLVKRDIKGRAATIGKELKMSGEEVAKILQTKGIKGLDKAIKDLPDTAQGAVRGMASDLILQQKRLAKGGPVGVATAARGLSPGGAIELTMKALGRFTGGAKLQDVVGTLAGEMAADKLGISEEQLDSMAKLEMAMDDERETLKKELEELRKKGANASKEEKVRLQQLEETGLSTAEQIDKAGYDQIFNAVDDSTKSQLKEAAKVENFAKMQTDLQQSLLDKLGILVDFFMNQFYNVVMDIWGLISSMPGMSSAETEIKRQVFLSKDKKLMDALEAATDKETGRVDVGKYTGQLIMQKGGIGEQVASVLDTYFSMTKRAKSGKAGAHEKEYVLDATNLMMKNLLATVQTSEGGFDPDKEAKVISKALNAAKDAGWGAVQIDDLKKVMEMQTTAGEKVDIQAAMDTIKTSELAPERRAEFFKKLVWQADPARLSSFTGPIEETAKFMGEMHKSGQKLDKSTTELFARAIDQGMYPTYQQMKDTYTKQGMTLTEEEYNSEKQDIIAEANKQGIKLSEDTLKQAGITAESSKKTADTLSTPGTAYFKMPKNVLTGEYQDTIYDAMLDALRLALFEYFMYSELDRDKVTEFMTQQGMTPLDFVEGVSEGLGQGQGPKEWYGIEATAKKSQFGAIVTGIKGGKAILKPPPIGEAFAAVKPGEEIVPSYGRGGGGRGGGTTHVVISLNPSAQQMFRAEVQDGIYEHERRKRYG
jgi:hypothetical protein